MVCELARMNATPWARKMSIQNSAATTASFFSVASFIRGLRWLYGPGVGDKTGMIVS
jgi:hypothetical protein